MCVVWQHLLYGVHEKCNDTPRARHCGFSTVYTELHMWHALMECRMNGMVLEARGGGKRVGFGDRGTKKKNPIPILQPRHISQPWHCWAETAEREWKEHPGGESMIKSIFCACFSFMHSLCRFMDDDVSQGSLNGQSRKGFMGQTQGACPKTTGS